jgi:5'-methylthioadenosine phosphorylase
VENVLEVLRKNVALSQTIIRNALPKIRPERTCPCAAALQNAVVTPHALIPPKTRKSLRLILEKYSPAARRSGKPGRSGASS